MASAVHAHKLGRGAIRNLCYLVIDPASGDALAIDPAWDQDALEQTLSAHDARLVGVLLTHAHHDHVNLAQALVVRHGARAFMSRTEIDGWGFRCSSLQALAGEQAFEVGAFRVEPLSTPGHTSGGLCYAIDGNLFTGDTLFTEGCGICHGRTASPEQMYESLQRIKSAVVPQTRLFPGHSFGQPPGQSFAAVNRLNIYLQFTRQDEFVRFRMRPNQPSSYRFA